MSVKQVLVVSLAAVLIVSATSYFILRQTSYPVPKTDVIGYPPQGLPYRQLTSGSWDDVNPEWSPDGSRLLYYSVTSTPQLMCLDVKASSALLLTAVNGTDLSLGWAGTDRVVFSSRFSGVYRICWFNLTSMRQGYLTTGSSDSRGGTISPDGTKVAYYSDVPLNRSAYNIFDISGYNVWVSRLNLTEYDVWAEGLEGLYSSYLYEQGGESQQYRPGYIMTAEPLRWSADGKYLACVLDNGALGPGVYVWLVGTSAVTKAGPSTGVAYHPSWSPNEPMPAFSCNSTGSYHIWTYNAAGMASSSGPVGY